MNNSPSVTILALLFMLPPAWGEIVSKEKCEAGLMRKEYRQDVRRSFTAQYAEKIYASEKQNQEWIDVALAGLPRIHIVAENSQLKRLNDKVFKDKDLVSALTNFHKELFLEELRQRLPGLSFEFYSDFKSIRLALREPVSAETYAALESVFTEADRRFYSSPVLAQITRGLDVSQPWFHMGVGRSADQAALAARYARIDGGEKRIRYYWESAVKENLERKLALVKALHTQLMTALQGTGLIDQTGLTLEIFIETRKAASARSLQASLAQLSHGPQVTLATAGLILKYLQATDEFSPNMLVAKREILTIHDAPFGAVSLDFIGLGAENLRATATAKALVESRDLDGALTQARVEERAVTGLFIKRKEMVRAVVAEFFAGEASARFSGDDGIIIPLREFPLRDQLFLIQKLSAQMPRPYFRMALIGLGGTISAESSQLTSQAESIEKKLRAQMLEEVGPAIVNEMNFSVAIYDTRPERKVFLGYGANRVLTASEKNILKNIFPKAALAVQADLQALGETVAYEICDIFAVGGGSQKPRIIIFDEFQHPRGAAEPLSR